MGAYLLRPDTGHLSDLESRSSPSWALWWLYSWLMTLIVLGDPGPEASQPRFRTYRKCEIIYVCSFQWLTLGISCYTAIDTSTRYNWIPYTMSKICQPYKGLNYELCHAKGQCVCSLNWFPRWCNFVRYSLPPYAKNSSHFPLVSNDI